MAAGDLITRTYQGELQGLLFGLDTAYPFDADNPVGGLGLPGIRSSDVNRPQQHGIFVGPDWMEGKPLTFALGIFGADEASTETLIAALVAAFKPVDGTGTVPLVLRLAGTTKYLINGRPRRCAIDPRSLPQATASAVVQFLATDPRFYNNTQSTGSTGPGATSGGLAFPFAFPFAFGSSTPGSIGAINAGNIATYATARVTAGAGGIAGFTLAKAETGEMFTVVLAMSAGDYVDIDFLARTILLNGTASRIGNVSRPGSTWWALDPGTTTVTFAISGGTAATLDLAWRSAWLI